MAGRFGEMYARSCVCISSFGLQRVSDDRRSNAPALGKKNPRKTAQVTNDANNDGAKFANSWLSVAFSEINTRTSAEFGAANVQ